MFSYMPSMNSCDLKFMKIPFMVAPNKWRKNTDINLTNIYKICGQKATSDRRNQRFK